MACQSRAPAIRLITSSENGNDKWRRFLWCSHTGQQASGILLDGLQLVLEKPSAQKHQDLFGQHSPSYFFQGRIAGRRKKIGVIVHWLGLVF